MKKVILLLALTIFTLQTYSQSRWYSHFDTKINQVNSWNNVDSSFYLLWFKRDMKYSGFFPAQDTVETASAGFVLDPSTANFNSNFFHFNQMKITENEAYVLDSVKIYGLYNRNPNSISTDTLRVSIVSGDTSSNSNLPGFGWGFNWFITTYGDTLFTAMPFYDSTNKILGTNPSNNDTVIIKDILLTASLDSNTVQTNGINILELGALNIPVMANGNVAVALTFISGENYIPFDTIHPWGNQNPKYNYFSPFFFEENANAFPDNFKHDYNRGYIQELPQAVGYSNLYIPTSSYTNAAYDAETPRIDFKLNCTTCNYITPTISVVNQSNSDTIYNCPNIPVLLGCSFTPGNANLQWQLNGNNIPGAITDTLTPQVSGAYKMRVIVGTDTLYTNEIYNIQITAPNVTITPPGPIALCGGDSIQFVANYDSAFNYYWSLNSQQINSNLSDTTITVSQTGIYSLSMEQNNCTFNYTRSVQQNPAPDTTTVIPAGNSMEFCLGQPSHVQLYNNIPSIIQWYLNGSLILNSNSASHYPLTSGAYYAVLNANGCIDTSRTIQVTVNPSPIISISNQSLVLTASNTNYANYQWSMNTSPISGANGPTYSITQNGLYSLNVTDSNGCSSMSNTIQVSNVSINDVVNSHKFVVSPNPTSGTFNIIVERPFKKATYSILNLVGEKISSGNLYERNTKINHSDELAVGHYIIRLDVDNNFVYKKLLIED